MTEIIVEVEEVDYRGIRPVERVTGISRSKIEIIQAEVKLKITNGRVFNFRSTGYASDKEAAVKDAVERIKPFIPSTDKKVRIIF